MTGLSKIVGHNRILGIEVAFESEAAYSLQAVEVSLKRNILKLQPDENLPDKIEEISRVIPGHVPVCLVLSGKGIVIKSFTNDGANNEDEVIRQVLPMAQPSEFVSNTYVSPQGLSWVAIIRKEQLLQVVNSFIKAGYSVMDVLIGPLVMAEVVPLIEMENHSIFVSNYQILVNNHSISEILKHTGPSHIYSMAGQQVNGSHLLALAGSYKHLAIDQGSTSLRLDRVVTCANDYLIKRAINLYMKSALGLLFVLLMTNFLIYNHYNTKVNRINQEMIHNRSLLSQKVNLEKEVAEKKAILTASDLDTKSHLAYFADRISALRPEKLIFEEMVLNPVEINIFKQSLSIQKNIIQIKGNAHSSLIINNWVNELSKLDFVETTDLIDLKYSNNKKLTEFTLLIKVKC